MRPERALIHKLIEFGSAVQMAFAAGSSQDPSCRSLHEVSGNSGWFQPKASGTLVGWLTAIAFDAPAPAFGGPVAVDSWCDLTRLRFSAYLLGDPQLGLKDSAVWWLGDGVGVGVGEGTGFGWCLGAGRLFGEVVAHLIGTFGGLGLGVDGW